MVQVPPETDGMIKARLLRALGHRQDQERQIRDGKAPQGLQKGEDSPKPEGPGMEWLQNFLICQREREDEWRGNARSCD